MAHQAAQSAEFFYKTMDSPVGRLKLVGNADGLAAIMWAKDRPRRVNLSLIDEDLDLPILVETETQLNDYFASRRETFDLKLNFQGTEFQKSVWNALLRIPFGETRTYREIAVELGNVNATRAVGAANGRNPISIVAPCHRVIGADGSLTGYAGGLAAKATLLNLESTGRRLL
jgi:methylated-DNA-[protein]-cysteine S-methyltransferase